LIESYTDHAANERTYLAWVRTALALLAFGLLVERFDLYSRSLSDLSDPASDPGVSAIGRAAGLGLILLGVLVLSISSYRYLRFKQLIASREKRDFRASHTDLVLVGLVGTVGLAMSVYVVAQLF
jgi:putative membrane protein